MEALSEAEAPLPKLLPKWPFDPLAIAIPPACIEGWRSEIDEDDQHPVFWWPELRVMDPVLLEAQEARRGVAPPSDTAPRQVGVSRPYATYPQDWRAIQIGAGLLLDHVNRELRYAKTSHRLRAMTAEEIQAMSERIGLEARQWLAQAAGHAPFEATAEQTRNSFWSWLEGWKDFSAVLIQQAAVLSIEAALAESAEAASRIPKEAIACIDARHALATRTETGIFASTPHRMLAPPSYLLKKEEKFVWTKRFGAYEFNDATLSPLLSGRLQVSLLSGEPGFYQRHTYYGYRDLISIGVGGQYQKNGSVTTIPANAMAMPPTAAMTLADNYSYLTADLVIDKKLGDAGTVSLNGSFAKFDGDFNPWKSHFLVSVGYLIPGVVGIGKIRPSIRFQGAQSAAMGSALSTVIDAQIGYVIMPWFARVALGYRNYSTDLGKGATKGHQLFLGITVGDP